MENQWDLKEMKFSKDYGGGLIRILSVVIDRSITQDNKNKWDLWIV